MAARKITIAPEWSHVVDVQDVTKKPMRLKISPDKTACQALLPRLALVSLDSLEASVTLERDTGSMVIHVTGHIDAKITQSCVVTLEPIKTTISENFEAWYADPQEAVSLTRARHDRQASKGSKEMPVLDERDDPEPVIDGKIDIGELATQYLSLAIDPYPHKEGVRYEKGDDEPAPVKSELQKNPFAALKDWKNKLRGDDS